MQLTFRHDLPFVTATLTYPGVSIEIPGVLVDTGAASTIINTHQQRRLAFTSIRRTRFVACEESAATIMSSRDVLIASRSAIAVWMTSGSRSAR